MKSSNNTSLNRRILSSGASVVISLSLVLFVVGLLGLVLINAQRVSNYVKENIGFTIMLKEGVNEMEIMKFQKVLDAASFAKSSTFVSKEQATIDLQRDLGEDFVSFLGYSPLLPSIDVKLNATYANTDSLAVIKSELSKNTAVHAIFYQENLIDKLNSNVSRLSFFLLAFCLLLFVIAFALINNTIRLSVYSKALFSKGNLPRNLQFYLCYFYADWVHTNDTKRNSKYAKYYRFKNYWDYLCADIYFRISTQLGVYIFCSTKIYKTKRKRTLQLKHYLWILHLQKRITFYYLSV